VRRAAIAVVALAEWMGAAWANVNGDGYDWWRVALLLLMVLTLALLFVDTPELPRWTAVAGVLAGLVAIVLTTQRFNDSYRGSYVWPDLLACVFFAGVAAAELALLRRPASPR
jgi:peptidoglycan/LPS O-acetylase OafA/YrhL